MSQTEYWQKDNGQYYLVENQRLHSFPGEPHHPLGEWQELNHGEELHSFPGDPHHPLGEWQEQTHGEEQHLHLILEIFLGQPAQVEAWLSYHYSYQVVCGEMPGQCNPDQTFIPPPPVSSCRRIADGAHWDMTLICNSCIHGYRCICLVHCPPPKYTYAVSQICSK